MALAAQGKKGLIPFITAGDPDPARTVEFMHALAKGGHEVKLSSRDPSKLEPLAAEIATAWALDG